MQVFRHVNSIFNSNTYLITKSKKNYIYVVDPGSDSKDVLDWLNLNNKQLAGILLTHSHHDHIYGINDLLEYFPNASLYITQKMVEPLFSAKLNMSEYMGKTFTLNKSYYRNIEFLLEMSSSLLWNIVDVYVLSTPGHTVESISFKIDRFVFTGDSLIPGMKTVYRKKTGGNLLDNENSIKKIYNLFVGEKVLLPGHGKEFTLSKSKRVNTFCSLDSFSGFSMI